MDEDIAGSKADAAVKNVTTVTDWKKLIKNTIKNTLRPR